MNTVKEARNNEGPEKAARKGELPAGPKRQVSGVFGVCPPGCVPVYCGQPQALPCRFTCFFETVNSLLSRPGWLATSPALELSAVIPHLTFCVGSGIKLRSSACMVNTSFQTELKAPQAPPSSVLGMEPRT